MYSLLLLAGLAVFSPENLIKTEIAQAHKENKHIFLFFTADWCSWCHKMDGEVLHHEKLKDFMPEHYVVRHVKDTERLMVRRFSVKAFPTYIILDKTGKELNRGVGYKPYASFIEWHNSTWEKEKEQPDESKDRD